MNFISKIFSAATAIILPLLILPKAEAQEFNWNGPFIGAYLGYAAGKFSPETSYDGLGALLQAGLSAPNNAYEVSGTGTLRPRQFSGGLQLGQNWQVQNWVYGLVGDFGSFNLNHAINVIDAPDPNFPTTYSLQINANTYWLATLRARLGLIPLPNWPLLYLSAGLAVSEIKLSNNFIDGGGPLGAGSASNDNVKAGWTAGGGLELPLARNLSFIAEYLYIDLGQVTTTSDIISTESLVQIGPFSTTTKFTAQLFKIGLNYKFG